MPRPIRIEYPNAFYHVMNRGRSKQDIFHSNYHYLSFLETISEANIRFGVVVHAYCLMSNHYHLILETPNANLGRVMRHINGVYTQRYNRICKTDGSLFKGRYKAILIDEDDYLLELNRYVHKNPVETKIKLVSDLKDYRWSSYPAYLGLSDTPSWLCKERSLSMFRDDRNLLKRYEMYVEDKTSEEIKEFYRQVSLPLMLGKVSFKEKACEKFGKNNNGDNEGSDNYGIKKSIGKKLTMEQIIVFVSEIFDVTKELVTNHQQGYRRSNLARRFAMYLCQEYGDYKLKEIAEFFDLGNHRSASYPIWKVRQEVNQGEHVVELERFAFLVKET